MKTFYNVRGRLLAVVAISLTAVIITACGGGGGTTTGGSPSATGAVTKAVNCTIQANSSSCNATVEWTTANAVTPKLVVGTTMMGNTPSGSISVTLGNTTASVALYDGAVVLDSSKSVTGTCASGTSWNGTACAPTVATWWPPTFVPMGTKVYLDSTKAPAVAVVNATYPGQTQSGLLPAACKVTGDACWQEAVRNGTIKFISTSATDTTGKPVVFGFYKTVSTIVTPGAMLYCNKPFYANDGTYGGVSDVVENHCSPEEEISFAGNALGGVGLYIRNGSSICAQKKFDQNLVGWLETQVTCQ